jgi:hypothetical protein
MLSSITWPTLDSLINGQITFGDAGKIFTDLFTGMFTHENFTSLWSIVEGYLDMAGIFVTVGLLVLSLIQVFFGRKLIGFQKFIFFLTLGFVAGATILQPVLSDVGMNIAPWIVGAIIGIIAALFSKFLYLVCYIFLAGYATYMICMGGQLLPEAIVSFTQGNMIVSLVAVAVVLVLVLLLRKWIEMLGTAALGGWCVSMCISTLAMNLVSVEIPAIAGYVILGVFALFGFISQAKSRRRRYKF